jgi:hypothetical protein
MLKIIIILVILIPINILSIETGKLVFIETESGSKVYINNKYFGKAPILIKLLNNESTVKIEGANGYSEEVFFVNESIEEIYSYKPELKDYTSSLKISVKPENAKIHIDDTIYNTSELAIENIKTGIHQIKIFSDGYKTITKEINIKRNRENLFFFELEKLFKINFKYKFPLDSRITIKKSDNIYLFKSNEKIFLENGNYEIYIESDYLENSPIIQTININNNDILLDYQPILKKSKIIINGIRKNYKIFLDDVDVTNDIIGNIYKCDAGLHTLLVKNGSKNKIFELNLLPDKEHIINIKY